MAAVPSSRRARLLLATLSAPLLLACANEPRPTGGDPAPGQEVDACQLLTTGEIEQALGRGAGPPKPDPAGLGAAAPNCAWPSADGSEPQLAQIVITRGGARSYQEYVSTAREELGELYAEGQYRRVDGIGEYAVWIDYSGERSDEAGALQVFADGRTIQVTSRRGNGRGASENAALLARAALERLR